MYLAKGFDTLGFWGRRGWCTGLLQKKQLKVYSVIWFMPLQGPLNSKLMTASTTISTNTKDIHTWEKTAPNVLSALPTNIEKRSSSEHYWLNEGSYRDYLYSNILLKIIPCNVSHRFRVSVLFQHEWSSMIIKYWKQFQW